MTQGEIERLASGQAKIFTDLQTRIMTDIVRRIKLNGFSTASADWQISRLQQLGMSEADIRSWVQEALKASDEEIERIFSDEVYEQYMGHERVYRLNGAQQIPFEENQTLQQLVEAMKSQVSQECSNLAGSMGFAIRGPDGKITYTPLLEYYRTTLDNAVIDIQSGAFSYQTVLARTINQMTSSGLRWIDYDSGHRDRVDVAARRAVLTGFRQVQGKINEQVANDLGTDSYEVTWHVGARPTHQVWQGRVWTMKQLREVCGLGDVTGLHGANCYHDYNAFFPGVSIRTYTDEWLDEQNAKENTPKVYNGKEYTTYEALQEQRKMERAMRKYREDVKLLKEGGGSEEAIMLKKARYQGKMQEYEAFSKAMKLPVQKERIYQDGLRGSFSLTEKQLEKVYASGKIKLKDSSLHVAISDLLNGKSTDRQSLGERILAEYGVTGVSVNIKGMSEYGYCGIGIKDDILTVMDYNLNANDQRSIQYQIKTAFHEAYHASANGRKTDYAIMKNSKRWLDLEETFAESSAHYMAAEYGIADLTPSYADKLVSILPRLKKLPDFSECNTIADFGRVAQEKRQAGGGSEWKALSQKAMSGKFTYSSYVQQYFPEIRKDSSGYVKKILENMPGSVKYEKAMVKDLLAAMDHIDTFGHTLSDNETLMLNNAVAVAMNRIGVK